MRTTTSAAVRILIVGLLAALPSLASAADDDVKKIVADLDARYQRAVKSHDAATMASILDDNFVLVTGKGRVFTKKDLLEATRGNVVYERQDESEKTVRVWGDTAVVTALLWLKGKDGSQAFDYKLWYSDTYVRTAAGWRYAFGQASLPLPAAP